MAVRTYAQLISDISTYLVAKVRITQHSALVTNIVDTIFDAGNGSGARPYKVYTALLTQTGTNAPVATVLENTLGGTLVWSYFDVGNYTATLASAFPVNKVVSFNSVGAFPGGLFISLERVDDNSVTLITRDLSEVQQNAMLTLSSIEIRVYPT